MQNVVLVIHVLACIAMTGVIMLQRSEGGALGIGGGGGGLMSGQGVTSALVRTTMIFGGIFFVTSLSLNVLSNYTVDDQSVIDRTVEEEAPTQIDEDFDPITSDLLDDDPDRDDMERRLDIEAETIAPAEAQPAPERGDDPDNPNP